MEPRTKGIWIGVIIGVPVGGLLTVGLLLAAFFAFSLWMQSQFGSRNYADTLRHVEFPQEGRRTVYGQTDYAWTLRTLDGEPSSFEEFRGRPVFLNVWATWCAPCVAEMPGIERLFRSLEDDDVALVLVSSESSSTVREFLEREKLELPILLSNEAVPAEFAAAGLPATFVIDSEGRILFRHVGAADWDDDACREFLRSLS